AIGISKLPGTQATVMSSSADPWRRSASSAPSSNRCETSSLKRVTTMPKRMSVAFICPLYRFMRAMVAQLADKRRSRSCRIDDVQQVAQLLLLCLQVARAVRGRRPHQRLLIHHLEPVPAQPVVLLGIVGEH